MTSKMIPIVAVGPDDDEEQEAWLAALSRTIDDRAFCLGPRVTEFENASREYLGVAHAIGVSSGTDALLLALGAAGVEPGHEVIVPAYSFFASASSIALLGARPRFVDIDPTTLTIDLEATERALGPETRAVMPVHLYGQAALHFDQLLELCASRDVAVVEDAAQAFGVRYQEKSLGAHGVAGTFSFYPTKNLGAPGDAGMVVTDCDETADRLRLLRVHGDEGGYCHGRLGWNARMDGFCGAILSIRLARLPAIQETRARNARLYLEAMAEAGLTERLRPLARTEGSDHCWHQFIVRVPERDEIRARLAERNIQTGIYYPGTLPDQPAFAYLGHGRDDFPHARRAAEEVLALPIHHRLDPEDPARVVAALKECLP